MRTEDSYEEIARIILTEVGHDVARLMERKMEERYARINQLIGKRYTYCNELKFHISRIEALKTLNDREGELTDINGSARNHIQMGCSKRLSVEKNVDVVRKRTQIKMGRLKRVLLETDTARKHIEHVFNKGLVVIYMCSPPCLAIACSSNY